MTELPKALAPYLNGEALCKRPEIWLPYAPESIQLRTFWSLPPAWHCVYGEVRPLRMQYGRLGDRIQRMKQDRPEHKSYRESLEALVGAVHVEDQDGVRYYWEGRLSTELEPSMTRRLEDLGLVFSHTTAEIHYDIPEKLRPEGCGYQLKFYLEPGIVASLVPKANLHIKSPEHAWKIQQANRYAVEMYQTVVRMFWGRDATREVRT